MTAILTQADLNPTEPTDEPKPTSSPAEEQPAEKSVTKDPTPGVPPRGSMDTSGDKNLKRGRGAGADTSDPDCKNTSSPTKKPAKAAEGTDWSTAVRTEKGKRARGRGGSGRRGR